MHLLARVNISLKDMRNNYITQHMLALALLGSLLIPVGVIAVTFTGDVLFKGDLAVGGVLSKGSGTFVIDHPLDPKNKLLFHSFVESPDVKNIYDGVVQLNEQGEVTIKLPDYFEALNKDFRYQFSSLKVSSPNLYIKKEIQDNSFTISGGTPNTFVSWQVTGIRHDPFIIAHPTIVEVEKGPDTLVDKGEYLYPELYEQ